VVILRNFVQAALCSYVQMFIVVILRNFVLSAHCSCVQMFIVMILRNFYRLHSADMFKFFSSQLSRRYVCVLVDAARRYWRHILCSLFIFVAAFVL